MYGAMTAAPQVPFSASLPAKPSVRCRRSNSRRGAAVRVQFRPSLPARPFFHCIRSNSRRRPRKFEIVAELEKNPPPSSSSSSSSNLSDSHTQIPDSLSPPLHGIDSSSGSNNISKGNGIGMGNKDGEGGGLDLGWLPAFPHVLTASMANFLFGYHIGVVNGPIVSIAQDLGFEGDPLLEGLVVSIFIAGAFIGSLSSGTLVDNLGCRITFQITMIPLAIGALLSAQAHSLDEMLWGRFLVGLGIGVNTVLVPIYISEVSPTRYRGSLGTICQVGTCLGIIGSLLLGIPSESDPHWWRTMLYVASFPAFLLALCMQFAVESPRWLCKVGRWNDAKSIICNLWGESEVKSAIDEIQSVIASGGNDTESSWLELTVEPHKRAAFIGGALFILQQFAGINGVLYFSSLTFHDVGITSGALDSLLVGLTNFTGSLFALYLMDQQGRKGLLMGSYLGMAASMFLVSCSISCTLDEQLSHFLEVLGTIMYIFTFAAGAGPVTGLIIPELSSSRTRAKIMSFSFTVHWVCNFFVGLFFLELIEKFGVAPVYASFGGVSLLAAIFVRYFIVETKGRSLEELERSLFADLPHKGE